MKTQRHLVILAAALAAAVFVPVSFAQPHGKSDRPFRGEPRQEGRALMAKELNLSADQQTRIQAIHEAAREQRQAIIADTSISRDAKREKLEALREATVQRVDAVLTPEQAAKAQEMRANFQANREVRQEKMKERREKMKERRQSRN